MSRLENQANQEWKVTSLTLLSLSRFFSRIHVSNVPPHFPHPCPSAVKSGLRIGSPCKKACVRLSQPCNPMRACKISRAQDYPVRPAEQTFLHEPKLIDYLAFSLVSCFIHTKMACIAWPQLCKDKENKRKTTQAARRSLHQSRKRRHIGPKCCESPLPMEKITSGDLEGG